MNIYSLSLFLFSFGVLLVAALALAKRKDRVAIRFLIFSITVCGWGFLEAFLFTQNYSIGTSLILARILNASAAWIPIVWFHFVLDFLGKKEPVKYFYFLNYAIALILTILSPTKFFVSGVHSILNFKYYPTAGPFFHLFTGVFFMLVPFGFSYLIKAYRADDSHREQLKYFIIATVVGFMAGSTTFLPAYKVAFPLFLLPFMVVYPFFMGIGLIRYGLFDVQQIADAFQREKLAVIGTMAASLNHELRNPFYIAKGKIESHLDAIDRGLYPKEEKTYGVLQTSLQQLTRAMDIMHRFSDFAKPFNRNQDKERVLLRAAFEDVLKLAASEFEMQKIKLNNEATNGISVHANRRQLEEIFFNLIINACHAMEEKGGELSIKAAQPNGKIVIEISDTGPGIPEENQCRIFEPFFSTKAEKGTGLGLYITKQLVEKNGGKISVKSKVGRGTSFLLEFKR